MLIWMFDLQLFAPQDTADITQARRVVDMAREVALLQPSESPLVVILKRAKGRRRNAINPKFSWLEDQLKTRTARVEGAQTSGDATIEVEAGQGARFKVNDVVRNTATGENFLVTAVAGDALTVTRAFGETAAAAMSDADELVILGSAYTEGAGLGTEQYFDPTEQYNYTQIFRTTWAITGTLDASELYGGKDRRHQQKMNGIQHLVDMERSFLFGERKEDTSGAQPRRTTRGLLKWIATHVKDAGGTLTEMELEKFAEDLFAEGSDEKLAFCSPRALSVVNQFAHGKLQTRPKEKSFGLQVQDYVTAHGVLLLIPHPLLTGVEYGDYMVVVDPENIRYRPLQGRDTVLREEVQNPGDDKVQDEYLTEAGLEVRLEQTHGIIKNIG